MCTLTGLRNKIAQTSNGWQQTERRKRENPRLIENRVVLEIYKEWIGKTEQNGDSRSEDVSNIGSSTFSVNVRVEEKVY